MQQYNYLCLTNFILYYYKMTTLLCKLYLLIFICYTLKIKIKVDLQMETPKITTKSHRRTTQVQ